MSVEEIKKKLDEIIDNIDELDSDLSDLSETLDEKLEEMNEEIGGIVGQLNEIINTVDGLETNHSNVEFDREERDTEIRKLTHKVNEIMNHFEIEERKLVLLTQRKGINRELLKRLVAYKKYNYGQIAKIMGCSKLELIKIIDEMIDAGEIESDEIEGDKKK